MQWRWMSSVSLSVSFSTKTLGRSASSKCRDAGTAQPPWTFQTVRQRRLPCGSAPSSTLQCVGGHEPVLWPSCVSCMAQLRQETPCTTGWWSRMDAAQGVRSRAHVAFLGLVTLITTLSSCCLYGFWSLVLSASECGRQSACPSHVI